MKTGQTCEDEIQRAIEARRMALGKLAATHDQASQAGQQERGEAITEGEPSWGLALSGGGLRSTAFDLGVMSALAQRRLLLRFDLISTVAGGGYAASTFGAQLARARSAEDVRDAERMFAEIGNSSLGATLKLSGRYLTPSTLREALNGVGQYLRNLIALHLELGALAVTLGALLTALDIGTWALLIVFGSFMGENYFELLRYLPEWLPTLYLLLVPLLFWAAVTSIAYWITPLILEQRFRHLLSKERRQRLRDWSLASAVAALLMSFVAAALAYGQLVAIPTTVGQPFRTMFAFAAGSFLLAWILAWPCVRRLTDDCRIGHADTHDNDATERQVQACTEDVRSRLASRLLGLQMIAGAALLFGAVDRLGWHLAFETTPTVQVRTGALLAALAAICQVVIPLLSNPIRTGSIRWLTNWAASCLGYGLVFALCAWWVSLVHKAALGAAFQRHSPAFGDAWIVLVMITALGLAYLTLSGPSVRFLNLSSLHRYYRNQLIRGYLIPVAVPEFCSRQGLPNARPVAEGACRARHDIPLRAYRPQSHGGPIHLLNICVNQGRTFHPTRMTRLPDGQLLRVSSLDRLRVGDGPWVQPTTGGHLASLTLGSWMTISGTAVAGALTNGSSRGHAALAAVTGLRQGYWLQHSELDSIPSLSSDAPDPARQQERMSGGWAKMVNFLQDIFGPMDSGPVRDWFLTDGGHFDNTGAYALLAEQTQFIVMVDCSADPDFEYEDLEKLTHRARAELNADIQFLRPKARDLQFPGSATGESPPDPLWQQALEAFGSLYDVATSENRCCFALARISYQGKSREGLLVVIKPNVPGDLPISLANFKASHPRFPQDPASDPMFTQTHWENYFRLGRFLGDKLNRPLLMHLLDEWRSWFEPDLIAFLDSPRPASPAEPGAKPARTSQSQFRLRSAAMGASLGLGAFAATGLAVSQMIDKAQSEARALSDEERRALQALTDKWSALPAAGRQVGNDGDDPIAKLAGTILQTADQICRDGRIGWFETSPLAQRIYRDAINACGSVGKRMPMPPACAALKEASRSVVQSHFPMCLWMPFEDVASGGPPPRYWAFDYSFDAPYAHAHPCDPAAGERRKAALDLEAVTVGSATARMGDPAETDEAVSGCGPLRDLKDGRERLKYAFLGPRSYTLAQSLSPTSNCTGRTIYTQTYGSVKNESLEPYLEHWRTLGAFVPEPLDVNAAARATNRLPPIPVETVTVRYHRDEDRACAKEIELNRSPTASWKVEPVSRRQRRAPGLIEVWVPPGNAVATLPPFKANRPSASSNDEPGT